MIRHLAIAASAVLMLSSPISSPASPLPDDKGVGTWVLLPLKRLGSGETAGAATVQVDVRARKLCYAIDLTDFSPVTEIRLTKGSETEPGSVVVPLRKSLRGPGWDNCVEVQPVVAEAILAAPSQHYVDVRTSASGSALRARLEGSSKTLPR